MAVTDVFIRRYADIELNDAWYGQDAAFMVQSVAMIRNILWHDTDYENVQDATDATYKAIHDVTALELGVEWLSPRMMPGGYYKNSYPAIVRAFLIMVPSVREGADKFVKQRLSLVEQAFKLKWQRVQSINAEYPKQMELARIRDDVGSGPKAAPPPRSIHSVPTRFAKMSEVAEPTPKQKAIAEMVEEQLRTFNQRQCRAANEKVNADFSAAVDELNERMRIAGYPLHFHNGLIQFKDDGRTTAEIHKPFWSLVADPVFASVDAQMKEAIDLRDRGERTAPFHAASALESVIKIISKRRGADTGKERSAYNFIDNLHSDRSGSVIEKWESDILKDLFGNVRNPFGHGPGDADLPKLTTEQGNWVIDTAMAWTKSLIMRL